jgi:hypothetical protein
MAPFFLQDPKYDIDYTLKDGLKVYPERYCLKRHLISARYQMAGNTVTMPKDLHD